MTGNTAPQGIELYQKQQYPEAEADLITSTRVRPDWAEGWRFLGFSQYAQGKQDLAAASIEKAIALEPDNAEARYGLGLVRAAQSKTDEAIACFDETLIRNSGHAAAKHALIGGLVFRGQKRLEDQDLERGESDLERAIKLDRKAPEPVIALSKYYLAYKQEGRAAKVLETALASIKGNKEVDDLALSLNVKASAAAVAAQQQSQARAAVTQIDEIPCPACKQLIMKWAIQCPHCGTQLKARPSTFDHHKGGPSTTWQEVAYYIVSVLFLLDGCRPLIAGLLLQHTPLAGISGFLMFWGAVQVIVAVGMLFKWETLMFVAKIFAYLTLLFSAYGMMLGFALGIKAAIMPFISLIVAGFMVYLINFTSDV